MSADLIHHRAWRWAGHHVGTSHTAGPQPLRSAEECEPDWEPPAERTMPFGFALSADPPGCRPGCKPGGACRWTGCENYQPTPKPDPWADWNGDQA